MFCDRRVRVYRLQSRARTAGARPPGQGTAASRTRRLAGCWAWKLERVAGDLLDRQLLERELAGCDWCFHAAASYHLWMRDYAPMYAVNVEGTRNVLEAAGQAGCQKIVYTSTVGCIGLPAVTNGQIIPATESEYRVPRRADWCVQAVKISSGSGGPGVFPQQADCRSSSSIPRRRLAPAT